VTTASNGAVSPNGVIHLHVAGTVDTNRVAHTNGVVLAPVIAVTDLTKDYHLAANVVHALRAINLEWRSTKASSWPSWVPPVQASPPS
jgi:hypothetical protein